MAANTLFAVIAEVDPVDDQVTAETDSGQGFEFRLNLISGSHSMGSLIGRKVILTLSPKNSVTRVELTAL